jgi:hypothetical protein
MLGHAIRHWVCLVPAFTATELSSRPAALRLLIIAMEKELITLTRTVAALVQAARKLDIHSSDKLVLLALADSVNEKRQDGKCWPSVAALSKKTSLSERTIQRSLKRLCGAGHLLMQERYGRSYMFTITPVTLTPPSESHAVSESLPPPSGCRQTPVRLTPRIRRESEIEPEGRGTRLPNDFGLNPERRARRATANAWALYQGRATGASRNPRPD